MAPLLFSAQHLLLLRTTPVFMQSSSIAIAVPQSDKRPILARSIEYFDGQIVDRHYHLCAQLIYATSGVMEVTTAQHVFLVPPQRALWMPAMCDHQMRARGAVSVRTVYLRADTLPTFRDQPRSIQVSDLLRELIVCAATIPVGEEGQKRNAQILSLLVEEIDYAPESALCLRTGEDSRLRKVCEGLLADPGDNGDLTEWAIRVGASSRTLARLFQAELGVPFVTWRQHLRVLASLPRLELGDPVTVVAADMGYENQGAFATVFRRLMGISPSSYCSKIKNRKS